MEEPLGGYSDDKDDATAFCEEYQAPDVVSLLVYPHSMCTTPDSGSAGDNVPCAFTEDQVSHSRTMWYVWTVVGWFLILLFPCLLMVLIANVCTRISKNKRLAAKMNEEKEKGEREREVGERLAKEQAVAEAPSLFTVTDRERERERGKESEVVGEYTSVSVAHGKLEPVPVAPMAPLDPMPTVASITPIVPPVPIGEDDASITPIAGDASYNPYVHAATEAGRGGVQGYNPYPLGVGGVSDQYPVSAHGLVPQPNH
ncbi:hypothetical protein KIPB_011012 [Kipferlia bialata]|uniref:Transmembrane protein n=1 Tax=Kipferlia bialata TaxID=797122 RepID=A0A9K3D5X1_9EUKA|nr:hypothetical protein KIPB_011012 [Kipferlia bialata]|eukprot:g11012.t1